MTLVLSPREVANFAECSEEDLRQAIAAGHHFATLAEAHRHFERKRPSKKSAVKETARVPEEEGQSSSVAQLSAIFEAVFV
jgi:hypothetical protein